MSMGVHECALLGSACLEEPDEKGREETGMVEKKDRRAILPGLLLVRQIFSRWGGRGGEVRQDSENERKQRKC